MKRKLGFALDEDGNSIAIESLKGKKRGTYRCLLCKKEVIPKMGKEKVWHFSHKGKDCPLTARPAALDAEQTQATSLEAFSQKTIPLSEMEIRFDPNIITCQLCKLSVNRLLAVDIGKGRFLCKECFRGFDRTKLDDLGG
ncbi:MAG: hypothetical protein GXP63_03550 [DPANN group archaeon]|nr:hypothetical protein [DPANN group archaeon]